MYCKRCLAALEQPADDLPAANADQRPGDRPTVLPYASPRRGPSRCHRCFRAYDPDNPKTYLATLALTPREIVVKVVVTTIAGIGAACVVAVHQMAATSGH